MSTVFIAVQCFQCSTMQVKQRKKSSNKWSCVVCNEKQSVRKVFSQGPMAKDVRKFVQSFNMSRQFIEQQQELQEETLVHVQNENQTKKKRTDWSQYIESDVNDIEIDDDQGELCELNVVTELPKALFKKPKLRENYPTAGLDYEDAEKLRKPAFKKRILKKKISNPDKEPPPIAKENAKPVSQNRHKETEGCSKWREYHDRDNVDHGFAYKGSNPVTKWNGGDNVDCDLVYAGSSSLMGKLKRPVSKWSDFIDDDADDCQETGHAAFEAKVCDEIVEDDIHPDFL